MAIATPVAPPRFFTVDEFRLMGEAGVFAPEERVELVEGWIVRMSPIGDPHNGRTTRANRLFHDLFGRLAVIQVQGPLRLGDSSQVQPDVAVLRERADLYEQGTPVPANALLIVEIADSTIQYDLGAKASLYAVHGIVEYWVEDIPGDRLVVHRDPTPDGYRSVQTLTREDRLRPVSFPDVEIAVSELLG